MRDLRYALRFLWAHKPFTATAVLTLAIGLGANTALYGLLNSALRPLAVPNPDELVTIAADTKDDDTGGFQYGFSIDALKDFQQRAEPFSAVFAMAPRVGGLSADGHASQLWFGTASDNYFPALGVTPAVGTLFTASSGSSFVQPFSMMVATRDFASSLQARTVSEIGSMAIPDS